MAVVAITLATYALAVARGVLFFIRHQACRDTDKHIVGVVTVGGALFVVFQLMVWYEQPTLLLRMPILDSIWMAFNFFNAVLYLTLAHLFTRQMSRRTTEHDNEPV